MSDEMILSEIQPAIPSPIRVCSGGIAFLEADYIRKLTGADREYCDRETKTQLYERRDGRPKGDLYRVGAIANCIVCGMPDMKGVLTFAHIHICDLDLSPDADETRVFRLCWHHHHGCYDQGYISTLVLLEAEAVWIENKNRPKPHPRDVKIMRRVEAKEIEQKSVWGIKKADRRATFSPKSHLGWLFGQ